MDRDEQVGLLLVRDRRPRLQRNEGVVLARVDHFGAQPRFQQLAQPPSHVDDQVFFQQPVWTDRSRVVPAMAGINHDLANLQAQRPNQRAVARGRGSCFANVNICRAGGASALALAAARRRFFSAGASQVGRSRSVVSSAALLVCWRQHRAADLRPARATLRFLARRCHRRRLQ